MKKMIFLISALSLFFACEKENVVETNFLPGQWNLVKTELFENDTLKGMSESDELSASYYFYDCENNPEGKCDVYIEEDGEQELYSYDYDESANTIILNSSTLFLIDEMNSNQLKLSRSYGEFRSTYAFIKQH